MSPTRSTETDSRSTAIPYRAANRLWTHLSRRGPIRPTAGGGLVLVLASAVLSVATAGPLGTEMRIRWTVGTYYGPETAPTAVVLAAFPVLVAIAFLGLRGLAGVLERTGEFDAARGYYELTTLAVLSGVLVTQVAIIAANLW